MRAGREFQMSVFDIAGAVIQNLSGSASSYCVLALDSWVQGQKPPKSCVWVAP